MSFDGRIALVTGGSQGIGRAVALALAEAGASVAVAARTIPPLEDTARELEARGVRALAVACDVAETSSVQSMVDRVAAKLGPIDILVNSAGVAESHKFIGHPDELWHRTLSINLTGVYLVCKAVMPAMVERRWGRIINIASVAGKTGGRYIAAYSASKHGVLGLTRSLALELAAFNITVNAVCPGYVDTPMTDAAIQNIAQRTGKSQAEARRALEAASPQNRLIQPEEVARVALMLAGEDAFGINGQAINVDGGTVVT